MNATSVEDTGHLRVSILQQLGGLFKGRISLQILLLLALVRLYAPIVNLAVKILSKIFPSFMKNRGHEEEHEEVNAPIKKIYESFVDDRLADVKAEDVNILSNKGYDKFKYVSDDFIARNGGIRRNLDEEEADEDAEEDDEYEDDDVDEGIYQEYDKNEIEIPRKNHQKVNALKKKLLIKETFEDIKNDVVEEKKPYRRRRRDRKRGAGVIESINEVETNNGVRSRSRAKVDTKLQASSSRGDSRKSRSRSQGRKK